jgi:signal transduction histidine kinase
MVPPSPKPRRVVLGVTLATIAIFGGLVALMTWQLRERLRDAVLRREAEAIHAVALMQLRGVDEGLSDFAPEFAMDDLFAAVLESSKLRGVLAVQLFDTRGTLRKSSTIPPEDAEASKWWPNRLGTPRARFLRDGTLQMAAPLEALRTGATGPVPLLDIAVPLNSVDLAAAPRAVARYWVHGASVAREFALLDRGLLVQAGIAFAAGAALVAFVLAWAFKRLAAANRQLTEQSLDLARANQELDFAAKTGALGAISAHLIHGLKNPLAGLEGFVADAATGAPDATRGEACRTAIETTRRLRALVTEVTTVLRDESEGAADYPVPIKEVVEAARARAAAMADQAGISVSGVAESDAVVSGRVANLVGLVLANLVANAIEASPRGAGVRILAGSEGNNVHCAVQDAGPGLAPSVQSELFRPVRSSKRGGGGVGLAISHRLAKHAGGNLELVRSGPTGTEFRLTVPAWSGVNRPSSSQPSR